MKQKYHNIITIDPDSEKSGVAFLNTESGKMEVSVLSFPQLLDYLRFAKEKESFDNTLAVYVEGGWLVKKSNYHGYYGSVAQKIAKNVGANHETGRKIVEMLEHYNIQHFVVHPLKKCWKGKDGKITKEELEDVMRNAGLEPIIGRTNQDVRDAALLCIYHSGLPIRVSTQRKRRQV